MLKPVFAIITGILDNGIITGSDKGLACITVFFFAVRILDELSSCFCNKSLMFLFFQKFPDTFFDPDGSFWR
jgi:hypothetical protein